MRTNPRHPHRQDVDYNCSFRPKIGAVSGHFAKLHAHPASESKSAVTKTTQKSIRRMDSTWVDRDTNPLRKDILNMLLLTILYICQGLPVGLAFSSIPFIMRDKGFELHDLTYFKVCTLPYTCKIFWSPIVDSVFSKRLGRRKSWIVPMQTMAGIIFLYLSSAVGRSLDHGERVAVETLTASFFALVLLMASQDIAVDGWALTILSKENLSYGSTCQSIGLTVGFLFSHPIFLALNSVDASNNQVRYFLGFDESPEPILTIERFLYMCGTFILLVTIFLALFKREEPFLEERISIPQAYIELKRIASNKNVIKLTLVLLVAKIGFAVSDEVAHLRLQDKGFPKEKLAQVVLLAFPFEIIFSVICGKLASTSHPVNAWMMGMMGRIAMASVGPIFVYMYPDNLTSPDLFWVALLLGVGVIQSFVAKVSFVAQGAFFCSIADPLVGGTYQTYVNTISNFGGTWPGMVALRLVGDLTVEECRRKGEEVLLSDCLSRKGCMATHELTDDTIDCDVKAEGFYVVHVGFLVAGILMLAIIRPVLYRFRKLTAEDWKVENPGALPAYAKVS